MPGYSASARLQGGSPRFVAGGESVSRKTAGVGAVTAMLRDLEDRGWIDPAGRPFGERLADRWIDLREAWSQTTFFLFNPESWR